jgi:hypothetical protein
MSLFIELKRRNVFRVGAAYVVVGWLLLQAADILLDNFGAPEWVFKSFVALLLLGFPLAMFLSWAYELTPEGVKRAADVSAETSGSQAGKPIDWLILAGISGITRTCAALSSARPRSRPQVAIGFAARRAASLPGCCWRRGRPPAPRPCSRNPCGSLKRCSTRDAADMIATGLERVK